MHISHIALRVVSQSKCRKWGVSLAIASILMVSSMATAQADGVPVAERLPLDANSRIDVLGDVFAGLAPLAGTQNRLVMYHPQAVTHLMGAVSVLVNGAHHTSLVQGGYSQLCLATGDAQTSVRLRRVGGRSAGGVDPVLTLNLLGGQTQFLRVQEEDGRAVLKLVDQVQALQELKGLRTQMHTVSRVKNSTNCDVRHETSTEAAPSVHGFAVADASGQPAAPTPASEPVVKKEQILLSEDALFAFGKADLQHLIVDGQTTLQELVKRIQRDYREVEHIHVIGHADPLGKEAFNERLSQERANTVSQYLQQQLSVQGARVQAEGRGAREPKVQCPKTPGPETIACHQVNRRVTIHITGLSH